MLVQTNLIPLGTQEFASSNKQAHKVRMPLFVVVLMKIQEFSIVLFWFMCLQIFVCILSNFIYVEQSFHISMLITSEFD